MTTMKFHQIQTGAEPVLSEDHLEVVGFRPVLYLDERVVWAGDEIRPGDHEEVAEHEAQELFETALAWLMVQGEHKG